MRGAPPLNDHTDDDHRDDDPPIRAHIDAGTFDERSATEQNGYPHGAHYDDDPGLRNAQPGSAVLADDAKLAHQESHPIFGRQTPQVFNGHGAKATGTARRLDKRLQRSDETRPPRARLHRRYRLESHVGGWLKVAPPII